MVSVLLEKGADTRAKDFMGRTALEVAEKYNQGHVVQVLNSWEARFRILSYSSIAPSSGANSPT